MKAPIAIDVENVSKRYRLGMVARLNVSDELTYWFRKLTGRNPDVLSKVDASAASRTFCALRDVSFQVERGESVALIGKNGAGKSTMLKILSRITSPTTGRIVLSGRSGSMLEVGTGFHPELTGRENVYLNGSILGMRRTEIDRKFDAIVAFSGIEPFLDTPVKRYSSGMYVRLAFAVASHLEPDILIVDEVLAVGDAAFQRKCVDRMKEVASGGRTTVLFVSHSMANVRMLCSRCIWFESGRVRMDGPCESVAAVYEAEGLQGQPGKGAPR
jgi:lipopolysaccharide transport system ATP-binding protein